MAANPSKLPYFLAKHDYGGGNIDWDSIKRDVLGTTPLANNVATLTKSGHIALGVSLHVGRTGKHVREWAFVVESFLTRPAFM